MTLDLPALRARLREYDPAVPRCHTLIEVRRNYAPDFVPDADWADWDVVTTSRCCRSAGHEGPCRNTRLVMGWPGFATVTALLDEVERLRSEAATATFTGELRERARIGAFLHAESAWIQTHPNLEELYASDALTIVAEAVESGEYLDTKEEDG